MSLSVLPFALSPPLEAELRRAYAEPPRAYHHFGHVEEVLRHYAAVPAFDDAVSVALAILFHDAVYVPAAPDNEAKSADFARTAIERHASHLRAHVPHVESLVLLTARHGKLAPEDVDADAALFLDCDMAILGAAPGRFDRYERAIRAEYAEVPEDAYRAGRGAFLGRLLESDRIFLSDLFHARFDVAARENLRRALGVLHAVGPAKSR